MWYSHALLGMPAECDGCGALFDLQHALDCKKGGLVTQRHSEVRDALEDLVAMAYKEVVREPVVREADAAGGVPALIADTGVKGVWQPRLRHSLISMSLILTSSPMSATLWLCAFIG